MPDEVNKKPDEASAADAPQAYVAGDGIMFPSDEERIASQSGRKPVRGEHSARVVKERSDPAQSQTGVGIVGGGC